MRKPIRESSAWDTPQNPFSAFLHVRALDCGPSDIVRVCFLDRVMSVIFVGVVEGRPVDVLRMGRKVVPDGGWKVGVREIDAYGTSYFAREDNGMKTAKLGDMADARGSYIHASAAALIMTASIFRRESWYDAKIRSLHKRKEARHRSLCADGFWPS